MKPSLTFSLLVLILTLFSISFSPIESHPLFACNPQEELTNGHKFCNASLSTEERVRDLIGKLTLQEKITLLVNNASAVPRLGIKSYQWWSEALHGVSNTGPGVEFGGSFPGATSFPQVITTAASFNESLWQIMGEVVSDEARAMYNEGTAGLTYWSPNVNIFRDPRWGRGQETPGEDPLVAAKYAARYVQGLQDNAEGDRLKVAACCKHYTAYDLDNWTTVDRLHFNAKVSKQDLEDTYNVPFKACVQEGKVASVMCSFNQINGKPSCANPELLKGTIRAEWQLNGYIVADCDSVEVLYDNQHYTASQEEAAAVTIKSGLDLDCGTWLGEHTEKAVKRGLLREADVDNALTNTIAVQMRLGMFDGEKLGGKFGNLGSRDVCSPAHQQLALDAARQGIVLLKNSESSLPLSSQSHRTVAVIGPNSNVTVTMVGNYAGVACAYTSPLEGIGKYAKAIHHEGCADGVACEDVQGFEDAEATARLADATILVMGLNQSVEREAVDRLELLLPGQQPELVSRVAKASKGPIVLVLMSGGPIDVSFAKDDPRISAILWVGYPGQAGGAAIADILFGTTNPGGRLPMTWYPQSYVESVPMTNMDMRANPFTGYPGRTYRFYKGPVVYPFGYGLSYTTFSLELAEPPNDAVTVNVPAHASLHASIMRNGVKIEHANNCDELVIPVYINVKNTGTLDGSISLLLYSFPPAGIWATNKQLIGFEKVQLAAGDKQQVKVDVHVCKHLSAVDKYGDRRIPMGQHKLQIGDLEHVISVKANLQDIKPTRT